MADKEIPQFRNRRHEVFTFQISADTKLGLVDMLIETSARAMARIPWKGWGEIEPTSEELAEVDKLVNQVIAEEKQRQESDPDHTQN